MSRAVRVSGAYGLLALAWSLSGFLTTGPPLFNGEYPFGFLVYEVGGHLLFGALAGLATRDLELGLILTGESALIDTDHLLPVFGFHVMGRTAHSLLFIAVASLALGLITRREGRFNAGVAAVTVAAFLAHLGYDTLLLNGSFPLLAPLDFAVFSFPFAFSFVFEAAAVCVGALAGVWAGPRTGQAPRWGSKDKTAKWAGAPGKPPS